jgi:hypothetical protein
MLKLGAEAPAAVPARGLSARAGLWPTVDAAPDGLDALHGAEAGAAAPLLRLPPDVLRAVLQRLLPADRAALRAACRGGRAAANARVGTLVLSERDLEAAARLRLSALFPDATDLRITLDGSSAAAAAAAAASAAGSGSPLSGSPPGSLRPAAAPAPAAQLPGRFAGSCTLSGPVRGGGGAASVAEARAAAVLQLCCPQVCVGGRAACGPGCVRAGLRAGRAACGPGSAEALEGQHASGRGL